MTLSRVLIVSVSFVCAHEAVSQDTSPVHGRQPAISVSLRAEHSTVKAGTPITLKETLTNESDHAVAFGREVNHPGCAVDVIYESGQVSPDKKPGYRRGRYDPEQLARTLSPEQLAKSGALTGKLAWISLKPGEAFVEACDVSSFYDMSKPGVYKVSAQFNDPEGAGTVKSNLIELTVTKPQ